MSKKSKRIQSVKRARKTIRRNRITIGATAAVLAIGGIAARAFRRNPALGERSRELKDSIMRRLHTGASAVADTASQVAATNSH